MPVVTRTLRVETAGHGDIVDVTEAVAAHVRGAGLQSGTVTLFCPGSTGALTTVEFEPGVVADFKRLFDELAPAGRIYRHHEAWGDDNGHSHVRAGLLGPSLVIPFVSARLTLGTWQQIVFVDFDSRSRERELVLQMLGE